jgi:DNA-binding response OmpR family regulator
MEHPNNQFDQFVHALISPLTALHGAVALMQRDVQNGEYAETKPMADLLERSIDRLRQVADTLIMAAEVNDERLTISLPLSVLTKPGMAQFHAEEPVVVQSKEPHAVSEEQHQQAVAHGTVLLVVTPALAARLTRLLDCYSFQLVHAADPVSGIDVARTIHPDVIVLDTSLGRAVVRAAQSLSNDPDTKMIPLLACRDDTADLPPVSGLIRRVFEQARVPEALAEAISGTLAVDEQRRAKQRILVVDDEVDIGRVITLQFQNEGYQTTLVRNGTEALQIAQQQQFDLIILDLLLPDIDGFTVLGGLRAQPQTTLTPIILLSALNAPHEKVRGLELGADDYITKPFSTPELQARAQAAMRRSEREGGANPSTRLPGNMAIERAIALRIEAQQPFAVCYCDLDNFKAYNDTYGFFKGDAVIVRTAQILTEVIHEHGLPDDFVGHIGGDDFVVITTPDKVTEVCEAAITTFDEIVPLFYDPTARARGYIAGTDRQGHAAQFPMLSISIAVVSSDAKSISHPGEVSQRSIELKKRAKNLPGSAFIVE